MRLQFGLQPSPDAKMAWGARAIFAKETRTIQQKRKVRSVSGQMVTRLTTVRKSAMVVDLVWDRISVMPSDEVPKALKKKVEQGMRWVRKEAQNLSPEDETEIRKDLGDGFIVRASPRRSFGYLYIVVEGS